MEVFMARQPIFDRERRIYAYELLFRGGTSNIFPDINGDSATSRLLSSSFFTSDIEQITSGKKAFINFTKDLIKKGVPMIFPAGITVVELLENIEPDTELISICRELSKNGYILALDDFIYRPELDELIDLADIIKVDFRACSEFEIRDYAKDFGPRGIQMLAEKVETMEDFQLALDFGFSYFQGYFLSKPQVLRDHDIPSFKINQLQLMSEASSDNFRINELEKIISQDVSISYKLLKYLNSPFFRRSNPISSIKHALVMLGETGLRRFLSVIILSELSEDKPDELIKDSIIRARICESLAQLSGRKTDSAELFTLGLFSLIDAILDRNMEEILEKLPLAAPIKQTLMGNKTPLSDYLALAVNYNRGQWQETSRLVGNIAVEETQLPGIYFEALQSADALFEIRAD